MFKHVCMSSAQRMLSRILLLDRNVVGSNAQADFFSLHKGKPKVRMIAETV